MTRTLLAAGLLLACGTPPARAADAPAPTKEFEIRGDRPYLGGVPVKLWGYRCNNMLMSPAVTERLINNLDNLAAHLNEVPSRAER